MSVGLSTNGRMQLALNSYISNTASCLFVREAMAGINLSVC